MVNFYMYTTEKSHNVRKKFQIQIKIFFYQYSTTNKLDDSILVTYFLGIQEPVLELQTNSMMVYYQGT